MPHRAARSQLPDPANEEMPDNYDTGRCIATATADCRKSSRCADWGACSLNPTKQLCDDGTEFRSAPILWSGVAALSVGAIVLVLGGFKSMFDAAGDCSDDFCTSHALFLSGGALVTAGIAMAIAGGIKVHRQSGNVCLRSRGISWNF